MRAVIINTVNKYGSTGKIAFGLHNYLLKNGHESILCYGRGEASSGDDQVRLQGKFGLYMHAFLARITGLQGFFSPLATAKAIKIIEKQRSDTVYLMNLHGYYLNEFHLIDYLKKIGVRVIYLMLDEYAMTGKCTFSLECNGYKNGCGSCPQINEYPKSLFLDQSRRLYRYKKIAYKGFENIVFVSVPYVVDKSKKSGLLKNMNLVPLDEGIDLNNIFYPRYPIELKRELGIPEENIVILNVAPFSNVRKGSIHYLEAAKRLIKVDNLTFVHVGFDEDPRICPPNFIPIGYVRDQHRLAEYYSIADLFVCTSFADTIPNTCIESLSCGTPICGFDISGIPYTAPAPFGTYVEPGNVDQLIAVIETTKKKDDRIRMQCRNYAERRYSDTNYYNTLMLLGINSIGLDRSPDSQ